MTQKIGNVLYFYEDLDDDVAAEFDIKDLHTTTRWEDLKRDGFNSFEYTDEESHVIKGETSEEWSAVLELARKMADFTVECHQKKPSATNCTPSSTCCKAKKIVECCKPSIQQLTKCSTKSNCCPMYERDDPDKPSYTEGVTKDDLRVNPDLNKYQYSGDALVAVNLPLGPIGGGSIAIAGDGGLRQWQISNRVNHVGHVPNSFFALKLGSDPPIALQSSTHYDLSKFKPAPLITDHVVPDASKYLLSNVSGVKTVQVTAKFPVAEVSYSDEALGSLDVHLEAWSPKIPHQSKESGIPVIYFDYTVTNKGKESQSVSLIGSLQNIIGWDGKTSITNEVFCTGYGGNVNSLISSSQYYGLKMGNTLLPAKDQFNGELSIFCLPEEGDGASTLMQYQNIETLWGALKTSAHLPGQGVVGPSQVGKTYNGAVSLTRTIDGGKNSTFKFAIAWHIPDRVKDWDFFDSIPNTPTTIGTYYATQWKTLQDVIEDAVSTYTDRRCNTFKFRDAMFNSSLPWQVIDSVAGRISVLNSPTCMWHSDGNLYAFEGCSEQAGCCPLNCTHVWNYEMALAYLFPDLERTMRGIDLLHNITPWGAIPSRTPCPMLITRQWNNWKNYQIDQASTYVCLDGEIGTVLKVYREIKNGASKEWFDDMWPAVKLIMNRWLNDLDTKKEGMIFGAQPSTYDRALYGYNVLMGLLYLCALRATAVMANMQSDPDFMKECSDRFTLGSKNLDEKCYNGKWYVQSVDPQHQVELLTDSTFVGVMYGQWWAHILDLGYLLPQDHIKSHLMNTYTRNYVDSFDPATQKPRAFADQRDSGWVNGKWDEVPKNNLLYAFEMAWSGVVYPFATMLLLEGYSEQGMHVLELTRQFYDGTRRSPWNDIECGDHYARPMSSFTLMTLLSGQKCDLTSNGHYDVTFNPVLNKEDYTGFFIFPTCWGTFKQKIEKTSGQAELQLAHGILTLASFTLTNSTDVSNSLKVSCKGKKINAYNHTKEGDKLKIVFTEPVVVKENESLLVEYAM